MEDVLETYGSGNRSSPPAHLASTNFSKPLVSEAAAPLPARPATEESNRSEAEKKNPKYIREGSPSAFMITAPHLGLQQVFVGDKGKRTPRHSNRKRRGD